MERQAQHRLVRSFVRREGRITPSQQRALSERWSDYGVDAPAQRLEPAAVFGREAPLVVEIGFGNGDHLLQLAQNAPEKNIFGVEVHRPGVGRVLARASALKLRNLRVACYDAVEVLRDWLPESCLDELLIYFPDPWPKKRHHKRRLIQPVFAALAASRLKPGGTLRLATDWAGYAEYMLTVLNAEPMLRSLAPDGRFIARPAERAVTKFETRGTRLGHAVYDLAFVRPNPESRIPNPGLNVR